MKIGTHALSLEEIQEYGRMGVVSRAEKHGQTLWTDEEIELAYNLSKNPEYKRNKGRHVGKPDWVKITKVINERFHQNKDVRTRKTVCATVLFYKDILEERLEY